MNSEPPGGLSIQAVSELLAVPAATIRSWERRYGLGRSVRTGGGHRRYSEQDVAYLRRMQQEISRGRRPAEAAALLRGTAQVAEPYRSSIEALMDIAAGAEAYRLPALLDTCRDRFGVDEVIGKIVMPGLRQIGVEWQTGRCDIDQEHLITQATRRWLATTLSLARGPWHRHSIVLSCGPADLHTVGLEAMGVLLAQRGWRCHLLGERIPPAVLTAAITRTGAAAAIVVSHLPANRRATVTALRAAERAGIQLFYAGNAFLSPESRGSSPGTYLGDDLVEAAETVSASVQSRAGLPPPASG